MGIFQIQRANLLLVMLFVASLAGCPYWFDTSRPVPDVSGQALSTATESISAAGLAVGQVTEQCSDTVSAGSVVGQDPAGGASVSPGTVVHLVVSSGPCPPATVTVPDVTGQPLSSAEGILTESGLVSGQVTEECSDTVPAGSVVGQDPAGGASVSPGTVVHLVVSSGPCPVIFADPNLESAVRQTLGVGPGPITKADMLRLTTLSASQRNITSLAGLEHATNLEALYLQENQLTDLEALSGLTNLRTLVLNNNALTSEALSALSGLANLESLTLESNLITAVDSLSSLAKLTLLDLKGNQIEAVNALAGLSELKTLILWSNRLTDEDLQALSTLTGLTYLDLRDNLLTNVSALLSLTQLQTLHLTGNELDATSCESVIPQLTARGVSVSCEDCCSP